MRPRFTWRLRSRSLPLGERTLIMGILNITPDSFSDAGEFFDPERATQHALDMLRDGADILDIGGESTRPGALVADQAHVSADEELRRILPVIDAVRRARPDAILSVDTYKADTARRAVLAGCEIVNDVSAGRWDALMLPTIADLACGAVLMHMRGRPEEWRHLPPVGNMFDLVKHELAFFARQATGAGLDADRIVLDPGFGFGKNYEQNYPLLARFAELASLGYPLLAGTSRKRFIARTLGTNCVVADGVAQPPSAVQRSEADGLAQPPSAVQRSEAALSSRLYGTLATIAAAILNGAHIVRVHDVGPARDAALVADAILNSA